MLIWSSNCHLILLKSILLKCLLLQVQVLAYWKLLLHVVAIAKSALIETWSPTCYTRAKIVRLVRSRSFYSTKTRSSELMWLRAQTEAVATSKAIFNVKTSSLQKMRGVHIGLQNLSAIIETGVVMIAIILLTLIVVRSLALSLLPSGQLLLQSLS